MAVMPVVPTVMPPVPRVSVLPSLASRNLSAATVSVTTRPAIDMLAPSVMAALAPSVDRNVMVVAELGTSGVFDWPDNTLDEAVVQLLCVVPFEIAHTPVPPP